MADVGKLIMMFLIVVIVNIVTRFVLDALQITMPHNMVTSLTVICAWLAWFLVAVFDDEEGVD